MKNLTLCGVIFVILLGLIAIWYFTLTTVVSVKYISKVTYDERINEWCIYSDKSYPLLTTNDKELADVCIQACSIKSVVKITKKGSYRPQVFGKIFEAYFVNIEMGDSTLRGEKSPVIICGE